jgi:serine/threonine protein kinase
MEALIYLHANEIHHRDIKLENIFVKEDYTLKLGDFGFATKMKFSCSRSIGTQAYLAPECMYSTSFSNLKMDLWALGIVIFCLVVGRPPFENAARDNKHFRLLMDGEVEEFWR